MTGVSLLPRVLEYIFAAFTTNGESTSNLSIAVKNLRRHASSLLVKLGIKYPLLLLPVFDQINATVVNLLRQNPQQVSKMEKITLQEALLVISNHFCDYERQTNFVKETLTVCSVEWATMASIIRTGCDFVQFLGLDKIPNDDTEWLTNRKNIMCAVNLVLGVIRRCSWPDDPDRASRGGFVVGLTESGNPICRNPATPLVVPLLPHILSLMRVLNELFTPQALAMLSDGYKNVHAMMDNDKKGLMGLPLAMIDPMDPNIRKPMTSAEKCQTDLNVLFENCCHMMGSSGPSLGRDLYQLNGIANALIGSIFSNINHLPDHRLRPLIRVFLKPFVYSCSPAFYDSVLLPIFAHLAPLSK